MSSSPGAPIDTLCMACSDTSCDFKPVKLQRRAVGDMDLLLDMKYSGVCHSDLHSAAGHLDGLTGAKNFPHVPGHELAGVVVQVGSKVTKFAVGDHVGVGCIVDSCLNCDECKKGEEQKCKNKSTSTYQGKDLHGRAAVWPPEFTNASGKTVKGYTLGGYTTKMVITEQFAIKIPKSYPLECAGPVMCAGVTLYDPLKVYGCKAGSKVGIVGLGGLGQMGVRIAKAMGATVTVISRASSKEAFAKKCGADLFVVSADAEQMAKQVGTLDMVLNTIPSYHDYLVYQPLLTSNGIQILLGLHAGFVGAMLTDNIVGGKSRLKMSGIGGIRATQEVIDLCDKNKIYPEISIEPVTALNNIYTALDKANDTGVRYVLDISTLKEGVKCDAEPPQLGPNQSHFTLGAVIKELCYLLCCCKWR